MIGREAAMKYSTLCLAALCVFGRTALVEAAASATAWSPATSIDFREDNARRVSPVEVSYSPAFVAGGSAADGKVELLKISHYDTFHPSTQILVTASSPAVGGATLPAADAGSAFRLVLRAFDANNAFVGSISADVGLGVTAPLTPRTLADMADEKLDRLIQSGASPLLAYSDGWTNGVASIAIDIVLENGSVKSLFSNDAPADGTYGFVPVGEKRTRNAVRLHFYDSGHNEVCDPFVAYYTGITDFATRIIVQ